MASAETLEAKTKRGSAQANTFKNILLDDSSLTRAYRHHYQKSQEIKIFGFFLLPRQKGHQCRYHTNLVNSF